MKTGKPPRVITALTVDYRMWSEPHITYRDQKGNEVSAEDFNQCREYAKRFGYSGIQIRSSQPRKKDKAKPSQKPISNRLPAVTIEYDCKGSRESKSFSNAHAAKRFFVTKFNQDRNPKVVKGSIG